MYINNLLILCKTFKVRVIKTRAFQNFRVLFCKCLSIPSSSKTIFITNVFSLKHSHAIHHLKLLQYLLMTGMKTDFLAGEKFCPRLKSHFPSISQANMYFFSLGKNFFVRNKNKFGWDKNDFVQADGQGINVLLDFKQSLKCPYLYIKFY